MSELLIDSTIDESKTNSPIKVTRQEINDEVAYLPRTQKKSKRTKLRSEKINDIKMKLGSNVMGRWSGKTKEDHKHPARIAIFKKGSGGCR